MTDHLEKSNSKVDDFIVYSWFEMGFAVMRVPFSFYSLKYCSIFSDFRALNTTFVGTL